MKKLSAKVVIQKKETRQKQISKGWQYEEHQNNFNKVRLQRFSKT